MSGAVVATPTPGLANKPIQDDVGIKQLAEYLTLVIYFCY